MTAANEATFGGAAPLRGTLAVPGDKSLSHRALLFAALADGRCRLQGLATGDDVHAMRLAVEHLGVKVHTGRDHVVSVSGVGAGGLREPDVVLDCENSGTAIRLLLGVLAGTPGHAVLSGDQYLRRRPMRRVADPLRAMGAHIDGRADGDLAPLAVRGTTLRGRRHELAVASAQVKSALVLAGLNAEGVTEVVSPALSRDHTERMLAAFGAPIETDGLTVRVERGGWGAFDFDVPADPSSAAFFVVAACITPGSDVELTGVSLNPTRIGFVDVLARMGADVTVTETEVRAGEPVGTIRARHGALVGTVVDGPEVPWVIDEIPVLAMAAAFAQGVTEFRDVAELAVKETNRIGAIEQELTQLGIGVEAGTDRLVVHGGAPRPGLLKSHGDHRMAMACAVAAHALEGSSTVRGWRAITSSYPEFAEHFAQLGAVSA